MNATSCVRTCRPPTSGLRLRSPIVASAGPLTGDPECWEALEAAGAGAIVLPSLFEEQIEREAFAMEAMPSARRRAVASRPATCPRWTPPAPPTATSPWSSWPGSDCRSR